MNPLPESGNAIFLRGHIAKMSNWLVLCMILTLPGFNAVAQSFSVLHNFDAPAYGGTNEDGSQPLNLIAAGGTLYGGAQAGFFGRGTLFTINSDGTAFTNLYYCTASDGNDPTELSLLGDTFYGLTSGASGYGAVFTLNSTGFRLLYSFSNLDGNQRNTDGALPRGLMLSDGVLYGTAQWGGVYGSGTVFKIKTDGTGFRNLHSFTGYADGGEPRGGLTISSNILYGTTSYGTIFKIYTDGTGFGTLHTFNGRDGAEPGQTLILSSNTLYGTAYSQGSSGFGTLFSLKIDGSGFTLLHEFASSQSFTNEGYPNGLILYGSRLYGTTSALGGTRLGTVFRAKTDGTEFQTIHSFTGVDGGDPSQLVSLDNNLFGITYGGGSNGGGTVFRISLPSLIPQTLTIAQDNAGGYLLTFKGTANTAYRLQRASELTGPWTMSAAQSADDSGVVEFHDLFPPSDRAFYRVMRQ
jgi:uncharacterized repeat protein (TIGR03803 family)